MKPISGIRISVQNMTPTLPGSKFCSLIIERMWTPAAPHRKQAGPRIAASRMSTDQPHAEAREAELDLKRTVGPADEAGSSLVEDDVKDCIVDIGDADRKEEEPLEQRLSDYRPHDSLRGAGKRDGREDEPDNKQREGEVAEEEDAEYLNAHGRLRRSRFPSLRRGASANQI